MDRIFFDIPWIAPSLNVYERAHWAQRRRWKRAMGLHVFAKIGRKVPGVKSPAKVRFQMFRARRRLDRDNCVPMLKLGLDVLIELGWILNDSERYADPEILPSILVPVGQEKTTVEILY